MLNKHLFIFAHGCLPATVSAETIMHIGLIR